MTIKLKKKEGHIMGWFFNDSNEEERSHQDNFKSSYWDNEDWDNGSYQHCPYCNKKVAFEWDRCTICGNN